MSDNRRKIFGRYSEVFFLILGSILGMIGGLTNTLLEQRQQTKILVEQAQDRKRSEALLLLSSIDVEYAEILNDSLTFIPNIKLGAEDVASLKQRREKYYSQLFVWNFKMPNRAAAIRYYFGEDAKKFWSERIIEKFNESRDVLYLLDENNAKTIYEEIRLKYYDIALDFSYFSFTCNGIAYSGFKNEFSLSNYDNFMKTLSPIKEEQPQKVK